MVNQFSALTEERKPAKVISWLNIGMPTLQDRISELMAAMNWTHADVVRISGQSSSVVSQWRGNSSKLIKSIKKMEAAMALSEASGFEALWIAEGKGSKLRGAATPSRGVDQDMSQARPIVSLPRVAWGALMTSDLSQPFELEVADGAFGGEIPPGCIMRLDPGREPRAGWPVLVRDSGGAFYLRDYQQAGGGRWQAVARVRGFAPLDSVDDGLEVVAVMKGVDWP